MTFVVMGLGTVLNALTNRRDPASGLTPPILKALAIAGVPVLMLVLATELPSLREALDTAGLTGRQWFACLGLASLLAIVIEGRKLLLRRRTAEGPPLDVRDAVAPGRARI
jgi:Ca2+-transporting ATPase